MVPFLWASSHPILTQLHQQTTIDEKVGTMPFCSFYLFAPLQHAIEGAFAAQFDAKSGRNGATGRLVDGWIGFIENMGFSWRWWTDRDIFDLHIFKIINPYVYIGLAWKFSFNFVNPCHIFLILRNTTLFKNLPVCSLF